MKPAMASEERHGEQAKTWICCPAEYNGAPNTDEPVILIITCQMIARCGKSFSDGEFVKKSLTAVTKVYPDKKDTLIAMSLYLQSPGELKKWGIIYMCS